MQRSMQKHLDLHSGKNKIRGNIMTDNKAAIMKIRKVLALAKNPGTKEEGEAAMLAAQRMMAENNIVEADVNVANPIQKEVVAEAGSTNKRPVWWYGNLASILADNFKCYVYIQQFKSTGVTSIMFLGMKNDVELVKEVYAYAIKIIDYNSKKYADEHRHLGRYAGIKNQYIMGFLAGLKVKFDEQVKHNNWGLIVVKDALVEVKFKTMKLGKAPHTRAKVDSNDVARNDGYNHGKQFKPVAGELT